MGNATDNDQRVRKRKIPKDLDPVKAEYLSGLPDNLFRLHEGEGEPVISTINLEEKPSWLDEDLYRRGQEFVARNEIAMLITEIIAMMMYFSVPWGTAPFVYTGRSTTHYEGSIRYLFTHKFIMGFSKGEPWRKGTIAHQSLKAVRDMHEKYRVQMSKDDPETLQRLITVAGHGVTKPFNRWYEEALSDFKEVQCPVQHKYQIVHKENENKFFNQMIMSATQLGLIGFPIMKPKLFGIHNETKKDMEGFIHLWRVTGYYLGIDDKYNSCQGTFPEVLQLAQEAVDYWVKPSLKIVTEEWSHMAHIVADVPGIVWKIYFSSILLLLCDALEIPTKHIYQSLSFWEWLQYKIVSGSFYWLFRIPLVRKLFTKYMKRSLEEVTRLPADYMRHIRDRIKIFEEDENSLFYCFS